MSQANGKKDPVPSEVRVVVEVNGNPVGFLNLDMERLWPLINHHQRGTLPAEWLDSQHFESAIRAAAARISSPVPAGQTSTI